MSTRTITTAYGEGRLEVRAADTAIATLLLSHGAGNGVETHDLQALAAALPPEGVTVALFEQPWRVAGRKVATAPATLDAGLRAAVEALREAGIVDGTPLVVGGRSAGARSAARTARDLGAVGCVALAFPLHPPGKPERSRVEELRGAGVPTLVIQGENDPMGRPEEFPGLIGDVDLVVVPAADHSLRVAKRGPVDQEEADAIVVESTLEWLVREVAGAAATDRE